MLNIASNTFTIFGKEKVGPKISKNGNSINVLDLQHNKKKRKNLITTRVDYLIVSTKLSSDVVV